MLSRRSLSCTVEPPMSAARWGPAARLLSASRCWRSPWWQLGENQLLAGGMEGRRNSIILTFIAFGRAIYLLPVVVRFSALRALKRTTKWASTRANAGNYQLEANHRVTRIIDTSYAVAHVWSGFCLRQHGTSHPLCTVFLRRAQKNRTLTKERTLFPRQK